MKLAICSTNRKKYSETFIHSHYEMLGPGDLLLSDGYLPTSFSIDGGAQFSTIEKNNSPQSIPEIDFESKFVEALLRKHEIDIVLAEYGPSGVQLMPICENLNIPLVVHFHGYDAYRQDIMHSYGRQYPELFNSAALVIGVSQDMVDQLKKLGCSPEKIVLQPYGIDTEFFKPDPSLKSEFQLVSCGRFVHKKAPDLVIRAFAEIQSEIPNARLCMIGDGELLEESMALSKGLNVKHRIEFAGVLSPSQVRERLQSAAVFLQHSISPPNGDSEGTPLSVLEAMATGTAVVATEHGGIPELISHEMNGMLVKEGDYRGMAEAGLRAMRDKSFQSLLSSNARAFVTANHQKSRINNAFRLILRKIAL